MTQVPGAVRSLFEQSREELDRRVVILEDAVSALLGTGLGDELRASVAREAHKLRGSLGMFGLQAGADCVRELEAALARDEGPAFADAPRLAEVVLNLRGELDGTSDGAEAAADGEPGVDEPETGGEPLLIVNPDPELTEALSVEAIGRGLRPLTSPTCAGARRLIEEEPPAVAVLDVSFGHDARDALDLLTELGLGKPSVPVVVLTESEALVDRVEVARRGGRCFVLRARPASQVVDAVAEQIENTHSGEAKVLAVDDDLVVSTTVSAFLEARGLRVTTLNDPLRFWDVLEETEPDLLVLDLEMPGLDGIDLCKAVRADRRFGQLPVIFVTSHADAVLVQRIFEAGGDDYVAKPMIGLELGTKVLNRLDRVRLSRDLAEKDSITGLASRRQATEALEDLLVAADRRGQPVSVALIDLDHFKDLNDRLGHAGADGVLRHIGALIRETFSGEDVTGRWGGNEFIVGAYGMASDDAVQRVADMLEGFREQWFSGRKGSKAQVSFSAGVAEYPRDGRGLHELERAADEAVQSAKATGRDRVLPVGVGPGAETTSLDVVVVEDDEILAGLLVNSLETRGYSTRCIDDGLDAVAALAGEAPEASPALVLLDVDLPRLDGLSILRRLADDHVLERTRVILLTARAGEDEVVNALELGAFDHVAKPFSMPILMQRVRRALRR